MQKSILIIDDIHPYLLEQLPTIGYKVDYKPELLPNELSGIIANYEGLIVRSKTNITKEVLQKALKLKFIGRAGSGMEIIDVDFAESKSIVCFNTPEANMDAVGEQTVGMLLSLLANIHKSFKEVANSIWDREGNRGVELSQLTVGIIGYGHTGSSVAKKLSGFGCNIIAYDKYKSGFGSALVEEVDMETLFNTADVVSYHIPLTKETKGLINTQHLASFKKSIFLLNLSRGKIMETSAILDALNSNKLRGCALDVLENEKLNSFSFDERKQLSNLIAHPTVLITSHIGGWTHESYHKISLSLFKKIKQL